ncbi:MAG: YdbH domain-containing protein [Thermodesulfobacteriota bacterium]|jgi:hypothetical protein|nr:MAG: YdbH domain-containing protein [Thermodesulfobacteriota bacterium]
MKSARKTIILTASALLFIFSVAFFLQVTLLPGLVQKKIISELNKSGIADARVKVKSVTYRSAELENLNIGLEKKFHITKIRVSYSLGSLIKGKVKSINLYGARLEVGVKNRNMDLGPLSSITGGGKSDETLILPFANLFLKESFLLFNVEGQLMMVPLEATFRATENNTGVFELQARMKNAKIKTSAFVNFKTKLFKGAFTITKIDLNLLKLISTVYPSLKQISGRGHLNANGNLLYQNGQLTGQISVTGNHLSIETSAAREPLTLAINNLAATAVMDAAKNETKGSLNIEAVDLAAVSLSKIISLFHVDKNKLDMTVKSALGPWATVNVIGNLYFDRQGVNGTINVAIPEFTTRNKKWLAGLISPIKDDDLTGTFSAKARLKIEGGKILQRYSVEIKDGEWKKSGSDTGIQDINGVLGLNSVAPLITNGEQVFTFKNAHIGSFKIEKGQTIFNFAKKEILYIKSLDLNWAGGRLFSNNIPLDFSQSHLSCDLNVEALNLQDLLDFMDYHGVKGEGRIYGHVPITIKWGKHPRLAFGDGYLEARPPKGGLQFSKETAMKIVGIAKDIDPKTKNAQEIVSLMMLRALQDIEYSQLKVVFKNDENNVLQTRVQAQGYGPRGQKENIVPIGGLDITISSLDELLNRMVIPQLMGKH